MTGLAAALLAVATLAAQAPGVEGVIRSTEGDRPVAYAQVRVVGDSAADWTDSRGAYRLEGLAEGRWRIQVSHPGHDSLELDVVVPGDRAVRLDMTLRAHPGPAVDALAEFEPFQVAYTLPALLNSDAVSRIIQRLYPPSLVERGVGGEAVLRIWLDERGRVVRSMVSSSAGHPALDAIALAVSDSMRFRPARNRDDSVRVIVRMPVVFTGRWEEGGGEGG